MILDCKLRTPTHIAERIYDLLMFMCVCAYDSHQRDKYEPKSMLLFNISSTVFAFTYESATSRQIK